MENNGDVYRRRNRIQFIDAMRKMTIRALLLIAFVSASQAHGQVLSNADETPHERMNRLVDGVHNRVNEEAASYVLKVDRHLRKAEQMAGHVPAVLAAAPILGQRERTGR